MRNMGKVLANAFQGISNLLRGEREGVRPGEREEG